MSPLSHAELANWLEARADYLRRHSEPGTALELYTIAAALRDGKIIRLPMETET